MHLIELLLANTTKPQTQNQQAANPREIPLSPPTSTTPELKLCNTMLYPLFAGNAHYYQHFIDTIGIPQLNNLSQQLSHFIAQQTMLNNAKLAKLAPQQRQIVSLLSKQVLHQLGSLPVTHIASQLRLTHQTTSSQLKKLRDHHWVASTKVGRSSFYQLADITQSYSLAYNHLHPLHGESNGVNISIDFAQQWLKSSAIDLPSDDQQNFIVDNFTSKNSTVNASSINTTVLSEHFVAPPTKKPLNHSNIPAHLKLTALLPSLTD